MPRKKEFEKEHETCDAILKSISAELALRTYLESHLILNILF